ncbi:MAG: TPR domain protein [Rhodanobacteraceae bacterium]|jgi:tetratricopeptide (TPR) repeat protein|nr:MAG: TPR domain protein [Rhodanobacteraceae bacterium]
MGLLAGFPLLLDSACRRDAPAILTMPSVHAETMSPPASAGPRTAADIVPEESATGSLQQALTRARQFLPAAPALAIEQLHEVLRAVPGHPPALQLLAMAYALREEFPAALDILERLARAFPEHAAIQFDLGSTLHGAGRDHEAIAALRRAVKLDPDFPQAWRLLGDALWALGEREQAQTAYLDHVRHSTRDRDLLAAADAMTANRIPEAEALLRERLKQAPTDVAALRMLAEVAARLERNEDAAHLLERCLELAPDFLEARWNHALVLHRSNRPEEALAAIAQVLQRDPAHAACLNLKAAVLCRVGDYEEALALYRVLVREHPDTVKLWLSYGHALKTANHVEDAVAAYRRCVELEPAFGEAWWSLANLKMFRFEAADLDTMRRQLARKDLGDEDRLHLEFALGKALEDSDDCAASFQHYARGNAIRRAQLAYDASETTSRVAYIRTHYTREFFAARADAGCAAPDPIFVVGLPRAGSTLIEQILASHSQVEGTMELPEIASLTGELRKQAGANDAMPYHRALAALDAGALRALGERYLAATRIQRKTARPFFIDKMPNNFMHVGLIHLMLPNAKVIDARRHPMACGFSIFKQHFARGQGFSYSLDDIGRYYRDYVELMAHFDAVLPGRVCRVFYERLVEDTEAEVRRVLDYCGLAFEQDCLRFFDNRRPVRTASSEQVRRPIYRDGLDHWRNFAAWLQPLQAALGPALQAYPAASGRE